MKFNIGKLKLTDIKGVEVEAKMNEILGENIYYGIKDFKLAQKAKELYNTGEIDLDQEEINKIKELINNKERSTLQPIVIRELEQFLVIK